MNIQYIASCESELIRFRWTLMLFVEDHAVHSRLQLLVCFGYSATWYRTNGQFHARFAFVLSDVGHPCGQCLGLLQQLQRTLSWDKCVAADPQCAHSQRSTSRMARPQAPAASLLAASLLWVRDHDFQHNYVHQHVHEYVHQHNYLHQHFHEYVDEHNYVHQHVHEYVHEYVHQHKHFH